jgi:hypothetical protein
MDRMDASAHFGGAEPSIPPGSCPQYRAKRGTKLPIPLLSAASISRMKLPRTGMRVRLVKIAA